MAHYVVFDQLKGKIPAEFLTQSLDDDGDGVVDAFDQVRDDVELEINGILSTRYEVPFATAPLIVQAAAVLLCCEQCYKRRDVPDDKNPHAKAADSMRKTLRMIASGDIQLQVATPAVSAKVPGAAIIVEDSRLGNGGRIVG